MVPLDLKIDLQGRLGGMGRIKFQTPFRLSFSEVCSVSTRVTWGCVGGETSCRISWLHLKSNCFVLASVRETLFQLLIPASSKWSGWYSWDKLAKVSVLVIALYPSWRNCCFCVYLKRWRGPEQAQLPVPGVSGKWLMAWGCGISLELVGWPRGLLFIFLPTPSLGKGPAHNCLETAFAS